MPHALKIPLLIAGLILFGFQMTWSKDSPATWNLERTLIYEFDKAEKRQDALAHLAALFKARRYHRFTFPDGGPSFGFEKSFSGTKLSIMYAESFDKQSKNYNLTFSIRSYIEDGIPSRFAAVVKESEMFFEAFGKKIDYFAAYRVPGP